MKDPIGRPVLRVEDERLLKGEGRFTDDLMEKGQLHAVFVRSPHAHAWINRVDLSEAATMPGVRACIHGKALVKVGLKPINPLTRSPNFPVKNKDGSELPDVRRWPLAVDKVRFAGEPIAVVAATSIEQALAAAEAVEVEFEPLPSVINTEKAIKANAPLIWDEIGSNVCVDTEYGSREDVDLKFSQAHKIVSVTVDYPRHIVAFLEPRTVLARYDIERERFEVFTGCQSPHWFQKDIAEVLDVEPNQVRVVAHDTGGGFGARTSPSPEVAVTAWLAQFTGAPVKWVPSRSESFLTDSQSRDHQMHVQLGLDEEGRMTAIRLNSLWRLGAYLNPRSIWLYASYMSLMLCGVYRISAAHYCLKGVFSNTAQIGPFRGVARAEVSYAIERVVEEAARQLGIDRIALRRKNLIRRSDLPWTTPTGAFYTAADFYGNFKKLLNQIELDEFERRRQKSAESGQLRGLGFSVFVDSVGGSPNEFAEVEVKKEFVEARVGTKSIGTGHETSFAQVLSSQLQIPLKQIRIVDGDTDDLPAGTGTHGSRSMRIGGSAMFYSAEKVLEKGRSYAAEVFEVAIEDVDYSFGRFHIPGTDRQVSLFEVAKVAERKGDVLVASHEHNVRHAMFASGCQACEVEIDLDTGQVSIARLHAISDPGNIINPLIVDGQMHGGLTHGIGHAILERVFYEPETGQLVTGSFLDYTIPRADDVPDFDLIWNEIETDENPLGVKGVGEIGTMGCPAAVMNAIIDAFTPFGITDVQMPATSERIWRLLKNHPGR